MGDLRRNRDLGRARLKHGVKTPDSRLVNGNSRPGEPFERALIESAFRLAAIGKALVGVEGAFVRVNDALCHMIGYSAPELAELQLREITHPEDVDLGLEDV